MSHNTLSLLESPESLIHILRWRSIHQPLAQAYSFLQDGESEQVQLTYRELDRQARVIAAHLQQTVASGERALLLYPPGLDYIAAFFGCLYAGVIAVPAYPPQRKQRARTSARLQSIAQAAQPVIALTSSETLAKVGPEQTLTAISLPIPLVATDDLSPALAESWHEPAIQPETLAFLQYTSGSTATPKGVMVSHGNLLHNQRLIRQGFGHNEQTVVVGWLPLYHDMGLIGNVLQPLYLGVPAILMSPLAFLQRPVRWLQAISRFKATTSGGPNFAYDLCVEKITPEQRANLDLSNWQVAFNGAEPIRPATLERFAATFAECGFRREALYPCYGLAEATLIVAGGRAGSGPALGSFDAAALSRKHVLATNATDPQTATLVGCGQSLLDQQIVVVDPESRQRCAADQIGEIWVSGPSVAQGYWGCEEETEHTFQARLVEGSGPFLRTGDLGFMQADELFIAGRLKDLIIIRGQNYYPQDIEQTVERSHPALRQGACAAFGVSVEGQEQLVVAVEVERQQRDVDVAAVASAIRLAVTEQHELTVHGVVLLRVGTIPKTSSGKIQRRACRAGFLDDTLTVIGRSILDAEADAASAAQITREQLLSTPSDERQEIVTRYLQQLLAGVVGVDASAIAPEQPISELGLDSLAAVRLQHRIDTDLQVVVAMTTLLEGQSIQRVSDTILDQIATEDATAEPPLVPVPRDRRLPLSFAQERIWFLDQLASQQAAYTIPAIVRLCGPLNVVALEHSLNVIVERHEILRTTFRMEAGQPVQVVEPSRTLAIDAQDLRDIAPAERETQLHQRIGEVIQRRFDLQHGPLLRAALYQIDADEHVLLLTIHHIVADGWSMDVLMRELERWYHVLSTSEAQPDADSLPLQYADFASWQRAWLSTARERDLSYWQQQLAGLEPLKLPLSLGRERPATQSFHGATEWFTLAPDLVVALQSLSQRAGVTLFMTLLTAFQALLQRYSSQQDFGIATPVMGRRRHPLEQLIGCFVNTLVLRADLTGNPRFEEAIERTRAVCLQAYAHQDLPFEQLVEALQLPRDLSRNPLAQVQIVLQPASATALQLDGLVAQPVLIDAGMSKFDLTLTLEQSGDELAGSFQYNTDLFDAATIRRMVAHFTTLISNMAADPRQRLADVPLLTAAEEQQITVTWNETAADREPTCIHELIEAQAARTPDAVAVVFEHDSLSYAELNRRANRLAHQLQSLGVQPETRVGLFVERSLAMIVGVLGILKAGGAYVALDPALPASRLAWIVEDSQVKLAVGDRPIEGLAAESITHVALHPDGTIPYESCDSNPAARVLAEHTAYVIYTS
ncbi:MAG TPA: condensation domain-containing protein, partial [Herpetosiphonaceae bacterium]